MEFTQVSIYGKILTLVAPESVCERERERERETEGEREKGEETKDNEEEKVRKST